MNNIINKLLLFADTKIKYKMFYFSVIVLGLIAFLNAYFYIGLIEDGSHHFFEAITAKNIFLGHGGSVDFPYNSRYFPGLFSHLIVGLSVYAGIISIKHLVFIHTFVSYMLPAVYLGIIFFNMPDNKKKYFPFILLSFIVCVVFMMYQIWTENIPTAMFCWVIFVIYVFNDFENLSFFNKASLIVFSFMLISSHPMTVIFAPVLLLTGILKYIRTRDNIGIISKILLVLSYVFLFAGIIFNAYFIFKPIHPADDYLKFIFFEDADFIRFFCASVSALIMIFINSIKYRIIKDIIFTVICLIVFESVIFNVPLTTSYDYRTLGFYCPLFFLFLIIAVYCLKLKINFNYLKIFSIVVLAALFFNCLKYGSDWKEYTEYLNEYLKNKNTETEISLVKTVKNYNSQHLHLLPYLFVFIPKIHGVDKVKHIHIDYHSKLSISISKTIINKIDKLGKFNIVLQ